MRWRPLGRTWMRKRRMNSGDAFESTITTALDLKVDQHHRNDDDSDAPRHEREASVGTCRLINELKRDDRGSRPRPQGARQTARTDKRSKMRTNGEQGVCRRRCYCAAATRAEASSLRT